MWEIKKNTQGLTKNGDNILSKLKQVNKTNVMKESNVKTQVCFLILKAYILMLSYMCCYD